MARLPDDRLIAALKQVEVLALASTLCKWSKKARRERSLAVLRGLGYAGATPQPLPQGQHDAVELPAELQLSAEEKRATLEALDGPLYAKTAGISKPILLRLNEFVLQSSGRDYVHYEVCLFEFLAAASSPAVGIALLLLPLPLTGKRCTPAIAVVATAGAAAACTVAAPLPPLTLPSFFQHTTRFTHRRAQQC